METFNLDGYDFGGALASHVLARLYLSQSHMIQLYDARSSEDRHHHMKAVLLQLEALIALASTSIFTASDLPEGE